MELDKLHARKKLLLQDRLHVRKIFSVRQKFSDLTAPMKLFWDSKIDSYVDCRTVSRRKSTVKQGET